MHWRCTPGRQQQLAGLVLRQVDHPEAARSKQQGASSKQQVAKSAHPTLRLLDACIHWQLRKAKLNHLHQGDIRARRQPPVNTSHLSERINQAPECPAYIRQSSAGVPCGIYVRLLVCLQCNPSHLVLHRAEDVCVTVVVTRLDMAHHEVLKPDTALLL